MWIATNRFVQCVSFLLVLFSILPVQALAEDAPPRQTIVVLGDSIAAGYGVGMDKAFPALLEEKIKTAGLPYRVVNAGVSGDTTAGGARRIAWVLKQQVDVLIIELGGNDGLRGIAPEETRSNLEKIIDAARKKNPNVKILLAGMQMPPNMGAEYTAKFKSVFQEVARNKEATLIPHLLEGVGGKADLNQSDRIHPTEKGHEIVAENVWATLEPLLTRKESSQPAPAK